MVAMPCYANWESRRDLRSRVSRFDSEVGYQMKINMLKRKLIVWWYKLQKYPYNQPKSRQCFREIRRGLARNKKRVDKIMDSIKRASR